jgi:hypothetical protein
MPLKADPRGGGTNADGSRSSEYCSLCYENGKFHNPDMTVDEMKALIIEKLREKGYPRFIARFFTFGVSQLKRWRERG